MDDGFGERPSGQCATGHKAALLPTNDRHGALGDSTTGGGNGAAYGFTGLQDGERAVTAPETAAYKVDGEPTQSV